MWLDCCLNYQEPVCLAFGIVVCSACMVILHVDCTHMSISGDNGNRNMSLFAVQCTNTDR